jgi:Na+/proline symporter
VQLIVALGAQWLDQGVLDAGLSVLSLTTGPVLGAFLVGVLTRRVGATAMLIGMATGGGVLAWVWYSAAVGWTWFALIGAAVTAASALVASLVTPERHNASLVTDPDRAP